MFLAPIFLVDQNILELYYIMKGAPGTIRTRNLLIRSQALYPLSYGGDCVSGRYWPGGIVP
jgi:hypothetical protein